MWVLIKKTYTGEFGIFLKGLKYDLLKATIKHLRNRLGKKNVVNADAPWDVPKVKDKAMEEKKKVPKKPAGQKMQTSPKDRQFRPKNQGNNYRTKGR